MRNDRLVGKLDALRKQGGESKKPSTVQINKRPVRPAKDILDSLTLNSDQQEVFDSIINDVNAEQKLITLKGFAGVGKTYLTSAIVEYLLASTNLTIAMTAPTNKAVKVLDRAGLYVHPNLQYLTVHSLLGLREQITSDGKQIFVKLREQDAKINGVDLIVVDESSMLSDELFLGGKMITGLYDYAQMSGIQILFVGDQNQIPPIGQQDSIPFDTSLQKKYGIKEYTLNTIVRQAEGNPIIKVTKQIREAKSRPITFPLREDDIVDNEGVYFLNADNADHVWNLIGEYFTREEFKKDSNYVKVVAYTNKAVDAFNGRIRRILYGKNVGKITEFEKLIANSPIKSVVDGESIIFTTNDEFEVISIDKATGNYRGAELTYYALKVISDFSTTELTIHVIHEDSEEDLELILNHLVDVAKSKPKGSWEATGAWKDFYAFKEVFADVKYNYAITAHKSQGSTYNIAFVLESDININKKIEERNRIKYTACTRPKNKLYILE